MEKPERKRRGPIGLFIAFTNLGPDVSIPVVILMAACAGVALLRLIAGR